MATRAQQAAEILANGLGIQGESPEAPPPPPTTGDAPPAPMAEPEEQDEGESLASEEEAYFDHLAEALGLSVDDLYGTLVSMDLNGESQAQTIGFLKDYYQSSPQLKKELEAAKTERDSLSKALEEAKALAANPTGPIPTELLTAQMTALQWQQHMGNQQHWNNLKENDPDRYAIERVEASEHAQQAAAYAQWVADQWQRHQRDQQAQVLQEARRKLGESDPAWLDETERKSRYGTIRSWLESEGLDLGSVDLESQLTNPKMTIALLKAARQLKAASEAPTPTKTVGKPLSRATLQKARQSNEKKIAQIIDSARKNPTRTGKAKAAEELFKAHFSKG